MRFNSVTIKNFRNFEDISVDLTNKNVLFGMNDVGKTNFLYALRYFFDKDIRKQNFRDTDYYKKKVEIPIEIVIAIDISDTENADSQKLRAKLKGAILSNQDIVYIKVKADYDEKEMMGIPVLYWGGNLEELEEMKVHGTFFEIDYVFNAIYIDAYVDLYTLFKKNANKLLVNDKNQDKDILDSICKTCDELNAQISGLSGIRAFEEKIAPEYKKFRHDDISVSVKSEIAIKGLYSNIVPYIKQDTDDSLYPTSGEGRKKLLVYAIFDLLSQEEEEKKINIFLIEEPENHLHRSMQIALSHILFLDDKYQYLFMTTHSPYVLTEMDRVNLVRIYNEDKIVSRSVLYTVPTKFKSQRKMLNRGLVEAIFADKVLLVEGPSENVLFGKVLSEINPFYEADGIYILPVGGFGFRPYYEILDALQIDNIIKTDNDLRKIKGKEEYSVLGFSRLNKYIGEKILPDMRDNFRSCQQIQNYSNLLCNETRDLYKSVDDLSSVIIVCATSDNWVSSIVPYLDTEKKCALLRYSNANAETGANELTDENIEFTYVPQTPIADITTETAWLYSAVAKYFILPKYSVFDFRDEIPNEVVGNRRVLNYIKNAFGILDECIKQEDAVGFEKQIMLMANYLGYETKDEHCERLYRTICDKRYHSAFKIDDLKRIAITFHSSKGLEFEQVIMFVSDYRLSSEQDIYNHYVAVTRAKSKLIMVYIYDDWNAKQFAKNINKILAESNLKMSNVATVVNAIS